MHVYYMASSCFGGPETSQPYNKKNYGDLGASTDNTFLDLYNSSQDTQPHSLIVNYSAPDLPLHCSRRKNPKGYCKF